jgi:ResB-like family
MGVLRALWQRLTSPKTCVALAALFLVCGAAASVAIGRSPAPLQPVAGGPLSAGAAAGSPFWRYGLLAAVGLLAANASCCTAQRLVRAVRGRDSLGRLLPHVMHLAFVAVLLAHLLSAFSVARIDGLIVAQGGYLPVGGTGWTLSLERLDATVGAEWPPRDVAATVSLYRDRTKVARTVVRTNEPLFHGGYGFYLKYFGTTPRGVPYAVFDARHDPGAPAVLAAALLFTLANVLHIVASRRNDA